MYGCMRNNGLLRLHLSGKGAVVFADGLKRAVNQRRFGYRYAIFETRWTGGCTKRTQSG